MYDFCCCYCIVCVVRMMYKNNKWHKFHLYNSINLLIMLFATVCFILLCFVFISICVPCNERFSILMLTWWFWYVKHHKFNAIGKIIVVVTRKFYQMKTYPTDTWYNLLIESPLLRNIYWKPSVWNIFNINNDKYFK